MTTAAATTELTPTFARLLDKPDVTQAELAQHLDALAPDERVAQCRGLSGAAQKRLWQVCAGAPAFTLDNLVPASLGEGKQVIYAGKNSLLAFTHFEKRFMRQNGAVIGYNFQSMSFITGPGFFTVVQSPKDERELLFDYTKVPESAPATWPKLKPNTAGLSRFVYKDLNDYCRRVSRDVIIGSAFRLDKDMDSYFVLART